MELVAFARILREARLTAGLSQTELARRTGLQQAHLSDWERGTRPASRMSIITLILLAGTLHTTPHALLGWDNLVWVEDC